MAESTLVTLACASLARAKYKLVDGEAYVPDAPGLYAIYGASVTWLQLDLGDPQDARPLYVGKAEASLKAQDLKQHFKTGSTGQSTVRRTFAALLRDAYGFRGVPRNKEEPGKPSHFALEPDDEVELTKWMSERLELAIWEKSVDCTNMHAVEVGVLGRLIPPLNIQDNASSPWLKRVRAARRVMADDVRKWAADHGISI